MINPCLLRYWENLNKKPIYLRVIICMLILFTFKANAQRSEINRLKSDLKKSLSNTTRFHKLDTLAQAYCHFDEGDSVNFYIDSAIYYSNEAYLFAKKINDVQLQAIGLRGSAYAYQISGNLTKALQTELKILKLYEEVKDTVGLAYSSDNIGAIYDDLDEIYLSIEYQKRAYYLYKEIKFKAPMLEVASHIGYSYTLLNLPDSALHYFQEANTIITHGSQEDIDIILPFALFGLGKVNYLYGNYAIAIPYYKKSFELSKKLDYTPGDWYQFISCIGLGECYSKLSNTNEAIKYFKQAISLQSRDKLTPGVYIALANLYENDNPKLAYNYLSAGMNLRDSLFSTKNKIIVQNITNDEQDRQKAIQEQLKIEQEERKRNIQFMAIGIFIISFTIIFLLLSRTILVKPKVIRILGVVGLLISFEFLNLLLHPFLEKITHHSPFFMLVCLVILASLIVPIHHRLEKYVTSKFVEKNELIRIDVAKRILSENKIKKPSSTK